jgi:hypothetical protein
VKFRTRCFRGTYVMDVAAKSVTTSPMTPSAAEAGSNAMAFEVRGHYMQGEMAASSDFS